MRVHEKKKVPYSEELMKRIVELFQTGGMTHSDIALEVGVSPSSVQKWLADWRLGYRTRRVRGDL